MPTAHAAADDDYQSLQGYTYTITDDIGRTTYNVMILGVYVEHVRPVLMSVPAGTSHLVHGVWVVKPTD